MKIKTKKSAAGEKVPGAGRLPITRHLRLPVDIDKAVCEIAQSENRTVHNFLTQIISAHVSHMQGSRSGARSVKR